MNDTRRDGGDASPLLPSSAPALAELTRTIAHETALVLALDEALQAQRDCVAASDPAAIHASADAIGRALHTIEEARRRRGERVCDLTGRADTPLEHIENTYRDMLPAEFAPRRRALREAALKATQSAAINRGVLRHVIDAGEAYLQALFSSADHIAYAPGERREDVAAGAMVNRRA